MELEGVVDEYVRTGTTSGDAVVGVFEVREENLMKEEVDAESNCGAGGVRMGTPAAASRDSIVVASGGKSWGRTVLDIEGVGSRAFDLVAGVGTFVARGCEIAPMIVGVGRRGLEDLVGT